MSWRWVVKDLIGLTTSTPIAGVAIGLTASVTSLEARKLLKSFKLDESKLRELRKASEQDAGSVEASSSESYRVARTSSRRFTTTLVTSAAIPASRRSASWPRPFSRRATSTGSPGS